MSKIFSAIPDPTTTPESLREAILALKSAVEAITRQTKSSDEDYLGALGLSAVAASGSISDLLEVGVWTAYYPTVTAAVGTFTTVSAVGKYLKIGKITFLEVYITITTAGTAANDMYVPLPHDAVAGGWSACGRENTATGYGVAVRGDSNRATVTRAYDGTTIIASGRTVGISGFYEHV